MLPLNYAILKLFETGAELDTAAVMARLTNQYAKFRAFKVASVQESLMSAEKNDLLERSRFALDDAGDLHVYYRVTDYGRGMIARYIRPGHRAGQAESPTEVQPAA